MGYCSSSGCHSNRGTAVAVVATATGGTVVAVVVSTVIVIATGGAVVAVAVSTVVAVVVIATRGVVAVVISTVVALVVIAIVGTVVAVENKMCHRRQTDIV